MTESGKGARVPCFFMGVAQQQAGMLHIATIPPTHRKCVLPPGSGLASETALFGVEGMAAMGHMIAPVLRASIDQPCASHRPLAPPRP